MDRKRALTLVIVITVLLGILIVAAEAVVYFEREEDGATSLRITHFVSGGFDVYEGVIPVPTPCHELITRPEFRGGNPPILELLFHTISKSDLCAAVVTPMRFKVEYPEQSGAAIAVIINGLPYEVSLVEIAPRE